MRREERIAYRGLSATNTCGACTICARRGSPASQTRRHDGTEQCADAPGALFLDKEQNDDDDERERNHVGLEGRRRDFETLDRRQHRDGRRYRAVAVEERGAGEPHQHQHTALRSVLLLAQHERHQRHDAAFALVIGAHDEDDVFDRDDDHQRPEDEREDAEHVVGVDRHRVVRAAEDFLDRVERARADVTVDDTQRRERERRKARTPRCGDVRGCFVGGREAMISPFARAGSDSRRRSRSADVAVAQGRPRASAAGGRHRCGRSGCFRRSSAPRLRAADGDA